VRYCCHRYVKLTLGQGSKKQEKQTSTIKATLNPDWEVTEQPEPALVFELPEGLGTEQQAGRNAYRVLTVEVMPLAVCVQSCSRVSRCAYGLASLLTCANCCWLYYFVGLGLGCCTSG
jgi:hypothetical protein